MSGRFLTDWYLDLVLSVVDHYQFLSFQDCPYSPFAYDFLPDTDLT